MTTTIFVGLGGVALGAILGFISGTIFGASLWRTASADARKDDAIIYGIVTGESENEGEDDEADAWKRGGNRGHG